MEKPLYIVIEDIPVTQCNGVVLEGSIQAMELNQLEAYRAKRRLEEQNPEQSYKVEKI